MNINIQAKNDYSFLFAGLGGNKGSGYGLSTFLSDYASIKNGSYGKLMKAYYSKDAGDEVKSVVSNSTKKNNVRKTTSSLTADETKAYTDVQSASDKLKDSADKLLTVGTKSLFNKKDITTKDENGVESTERGYDTATIYSAVNDFVNNYNSLIKASGSVDNKSIDNRISNMESSTSINAKSLAGIGITVNKDNTLSIDKDTFMNTDMAKVKNVFNGAGSYGYSVSASASMVNYNADYALSKAATYTTGGTYNNAYNSGNMFNFYS